MPSLQYVPAEDQSGQSHALLDLFQSILFSLSGRFAEEKSSKALWKRTLSPTLIAQSLPWTAISMDFDSEVMGQAICHVKIWSGRIGERQTVSIGSYV